MEITEPVFNSDIPVLTPPSAIHDDTDMTPDDSPTSPGPPASATQFLDDLLSLLGDEIAPIPPDPALCTPQPRLLLPSNLSEDRAEAMEASIRCLTEDVHAAIRNAADWPAFEHIVHGLPHRLAAAINAFNPDPCKKNIASIPRGAAHTSKTKKTENAEIRRMNPRRLPRHHNEARLQDALTAMDHVQQTTPKDQRAVHRARRKVARINKAMKRSALRKQFHINESRCVAGIFRRALSSEDAPSR
jgi:hypothetical protein